MYYLLYVAMMVSCPAATTIRIAVVVVVLQELPVVVACNSRAQCNGYKLTLKSLLPDCNSVTVTVTVTFRYRSDDVTRCRQKDTKNMNKTPST
jgi:hypothetical protein